MTKAEAAIGYGLLLTFGVVVWQLWDLVGLLPAALVVHLALWGLVWVKKRGGSHAG